MTFPQGEEWKAEPLRSQIMAGAFGHGAAALVVDLGGGDVTVAEEILHLDNVNASVKEQGGGGGAERVRGIDALAAHDSVLTNNFLHRSGQPFEVVSDESPHRPRRNGVSGELSATGIKAGPEEGTARQPGLFHIFLDGLRGVEVNADGAALVALLMQTDGGLVAVLVKVGNLQPAIGGQPDTEI